MTSIESVTLEVPDPAAAEAFYAAAFGLGDKVGLRASQAPTTGFRGFMLSLVVSQPSTVDSLIGTALAGGATTLKPAAKGFWGYGGVVQDPGGALRQQVRRVRHPVVARQAGALQPPCRRQRRRRLPGRHRLAPDRHWQRRRALHRPGRVRVGGRTALSRAPQHNCITAITWDRRSSPPRRTIRARQSTTRQEGNVQ